MKIFISYAKEDTDVAIEIFDFLKNNNQNPWLDRKSLVPGENWKVGIKRNLLNSDYFLVLLSNNSVEKRGFVQREIKEAIDLLDEFPEQGIFIIPVRIDDCLVTNYRISELHWIDLFDDFNGGLEKILLSIGNSSCIHKSNKSTSLLVSSNTNDIKQKKQIVTDNNEKISYMPLIFLFVIIFWVYVEFSLYGDAALFIDDKDSDPLLSETSLLNILRVSIFSFIVYFINKWKEKKYGK